MSFVTSQFGIVVSAIMTTASLVSATAQRANQRAVVAEGVFRLPGQHPDRGRAVSSFTFFRECFCTGDERDVLLRLFDQLFGDFLAAPVLEGLLGRSW